MIPKIIHFIWFDNKGEPFPEKNILTLTSAVKNTLCEVWLHTNNPSYNIPGVKTKIIEFPTIINGVVFNPDEIIETKSNVGKYSSIHKGSRISHMTDIVRLDILKKYGGIYSDCDVLWFRSPFELFNKEFVIGFQNKSYKILCNAVIMSRPGHPALDIYKNWLESIYPAKKYWIPANPYHLIKERTDVTLADRHLFFPVKSFAVKDMKWADVEKSICVHLSASCVDIGNSEVVKDIKGSLGFT
jgi:hypothetical protein